MLKLAKGFYMALGMFWAVPLPFHVWDEKLTAVMIASFPLVGALIGAVWWAAGLLLVMLELPVMLAAAILTLAPFFVAGFIHLDGYMDTSDAHLSRRPLEDKLRILKDPHVGAFAVIMVAVLFLLQFAAVYTVVDGGRYFALVIAVCVLSRSCSALSIFVLHHMPQSNYAAMLGEKTGILPKIFIVIAGAGAVAFAFLYAGAFGLIASAAVILGYAWAMRPVYKGFGGASGDLLGYSQVRGELCGLIALALLQGVERWF